MNHPILGAGELASRLRSEMGTGTWSCVVVPEERITPIAYEIEQALRVGKTKFLRIALHGSAKPLIDRPHDVLVLLTGFATLTDEEWGHLDELRSSRVVRNEPALFLMAPESRLKLVRHAPNMASFMGGVVFGFDEQSGRLTEDERKRRLADLQHQFGKTDEDMIEMARSGTVLDEPEYAEWLVLLNRGDLLKR